MATVSVKFKCGQRVSCQGVVGQVTAIFIRGRGRSYEFSYVDDGRPTSVNAEECELSSTSDTAVGFRKHVDACS